MSLFRQLLIVALIGAVAAGGWYGFGRDLLFGDESIGDGPVAGAPPGGGGPSGGRPPGARGDGGGGPGGEPGGRLGGRASLVVTAPVVVDNSGIDVRAVGTAAAIQAVTVYPEVSGLVQEVVFTPGSMVEAGAELLRLTDADQDVALERATLAVETATSALARARRLAESNNITNVALSDVETALRRAEIDLRQAEVDLSRRTVRAPFAGRVGLTDVTVGDLVNSSTPVTTLDDMSAVSVTFDVPERATGLVAIGHPIAASAEALPGLRIDGEITEIDSRVDDVARTLRVRATLPNRESRLRPGMAITVLLRFDGQPRPQVPSLAIQWDREGPYVWKVVEETARRTGVDIVDRRSGEVTVVGELAADDLVVVEGLQSLRDGAAVRLGPAGRPGAGPGRGDRPGGPPGGDRREAPVAGAPAGSEAQPGARPGGGAVAGERRRGPRPAGTP